MTSFVRLRLHTVTCSSEPPAKAANAPKPVPPSVIEVSSPHRRRTLSLLEPHAVREGAAAQQQQPAVPGPPPLPPITTRGDGVLAAAKSFFLPRGFPNSVTEDYLPYQLVTIPAHITGWVSHSLATSSMISALAGGSGPAATVGITAAIKWITKDGLGAVGRLVVGGRLSSYFDEDPKRWRMIAELITTLGLALEIATQVSPANFVVLAGSGTLAKATAKGIGRPCFRVVQTHFAASNNVGDVAAKEEVWEVAAQLVGLATSVAVLGVLDAADAERMVIPVWAGVQAVHVALRYRALAELRLPWPNRKRAGTLVCAHVAGQQLPTVAEGNAAEHMLPGPDSAAPAAELGCTVDHLLEAWGGSGAGASSGSESPTSSFDASYDDLGGSSVASASGAGGTDTTADGSSALGQVLALYSGERYALTWRDGSARVLLWQDAGPRDMLRALWQAAWLDHVVGAAGQAAPASSAQLGESLRQMCTRFPEFEQLATAAGWHLDRAVLLSGPTRLAAQAQ